MRLEPRVLSAGISYSKSMVCGAVSRDGIADGKRGKKKKELYKKLLRDFIQGC